MKLPKPEISFALLFLIGEGLWTYFSYEYGTPAIIESKSWLTEELIDFSIIVVIAVLIYLIVRTYRLKQERSSKEYHDLFEASPIPMWIVDAKDKKFLLVNEAMLEKYGYSRDELGSMTTYDIRPPEEVERLNVFLQKVAEGIQDTGVWIHRKKNGEDFYVQTRTNKFRYQNKDSIIVLADDITDLIEKEKEISRLSLVEKNTVNGIIITGPDRKIEWVNEAFVEMTGYTFSEVLGKVPTDILHGAETGSQVEEEIKHAIESRSNYSGEILNYKKDGNKMWVQTTVSPVESDGKVEKYVAIFLDVTERKKQEEMVKMQNARLKEIAFASSHLIRAPLANILGLTDLIEEDKKVFDAELISHLKTSAQKLDEAITEMVKQSAGTSIDKPVA